MERPQFQKNDACYIGLYKAVSRAFFLVNNLSQAIVVYSKTFDGHSE